MTRIRIDPVTRASPVWLFDLDDTLHDTSFAMAGAVNRRMAAFIVERIGLPAPDADALRRRFWHRYGSTLAGLMREYGVDPHEFLDAVHEVEDFERHVRGPRGIAAALRRLPGRKILLTNGPRAYAHRLLFHLGIETLFDRRIVVEDMRVHGRLKPKPSRAMLTSVIARERVSRRRCILVEDSLVNLRAAKALGLRTVFVTGLRFRGRALGRPSAVDLKVQSVASLPRAIARLR